MKRPWPIDKFRLLNACCCGSQHFGDLVTANYWMDRVLTLFDRVLAEPNQASEALTVVLTLTFWGTYGPLLGQREKCLQFFKKRASLSLSTYGAFLLLKVVYAPVNLTWSSAEEIMDKISESIGWYRPRGDTTMGLHLITGQLTSFSQKCFSLLIIIF